MKNGSTKNERLKNTWIQKIIILFSLMDIRRCGMPIFHLLIALLINFLFMKKIEYPNRNLNGQADYQDYQPKGVHVFDFSVPQIYEINS